MDANQWPPILHEVGIIIAAIAAAIAAASSLRNGRILKNGGAIVGAVVRKALHKGTKKKTSKDGSRGLGPIPIEKPPDWFQPPELK